MGGLQAPSSTKVVTGEGSDFPEEPAQIKHDVSVEIGCDVQPTFDFGANGTFVMELKGFTVKLSTTVTPPLPVVDGMKSFSPWGSHKLKEGGEETELHFEVQTHGKFKLS